MSLLSKVLTNPNAIAIVKEGNDELTLRIRGCNIEQSPLSYPTVHLECIYDGKDHSMKTVTVPGNMQMKRAIFHQPATIVLWEDGSKTVVKCDARDTYDAKYGLALCFMKKALGNSSRALNDVLHRELKTNDETDVV